MKRHCHCGFREHFKHLKARKLGFVGGAFLVLHLLFHVLECLILPSILVGLGGHFAEEPVSAISEERVLSSEELAATQKWRYDFVAPAVQPFKNTDFYQISP